jgi:hypothetical protein
MQQTMILIQHGMLRGVLCLQGRQFVFPFSLFFLSSVSFFVCFPIEHSLKTRLQFKSRERARAEQCAAQDDAYRSINQN